MKKIILSAIAVVLAATGAVLLLEQYTMAESNVTRTVPVDTAAAKLVETGTYNFDKNHTFISFRVKHMGLIEVPGFFRDFKGTVNFDAKDITKSTVEFTAKTTSIDTGVAPRDNDLRSKNYFEVEKYPEMTFKSTKVAKKGKGWLVTGDFTLKGVTKSITIPFDISGWVPGGERSAAKMGITAETEINRRDYGVNGGGNLPSGVPTIADNVKIVLQIEAAKAKAPAPGE